MKHKTSGKRGKVPLKQILHLVHRFFIFLSAVLYIVLSFNSAIVAVGLLRGHDDPLLPTADTTFTLLAQYMGDSTVRDGPAVARVLQGSSAPVNGTLYLHSFENATFTACDNIPALQLAVFENNFLRALYQFVAEGTSYHITDLADSEMELIAPVVDCMTSDVLDGDTSSSRLHFLTRQRSNHDNVSLVIVSMSNQPYEIVAQGENGPAGVATVQIINDMRATNIGANYIVSIGYPFENFAFRAYEYVNLTAEGLWTLQSIPADEDDLPKLLTTANKDGFYIKAESEQSNINNQFWLTDTDAAQAVAHWRWHTKPVLHDSWAWVHVVQFVLGLGLLANMVILFLATYSNVRAGKWWVGDGFVSISTSQLANGALLLFSWFMNEYWVLHEFCFSIGFALTDVNTIYVNSAPMRAGVFTIYLSACGIIGHIFKERIDPFFATLCFLFGFELRIPILKAIPSLRDSIHDYAVYSYMRGVSDGSDGQNAISPMRFWATHAMGARNYGFVFKCLFPIYATLVFVVVYVIIRKVYRRVYPETLHVQRTNTPTAQSGNQEVLIAQKRVLTLFEVATGAELENRFGVVSDYETCLFIKGMKFASADGIYSTGFVIANKKYLLQTSDYWSIVLMKLMRRRYKNIYVYEVNGSTVQQMARLVYLNTLSIADLSAINVSVLS